LKSRKKWFTSKISCISLASDVGPMYLGTEEALGQASNDTPKRKIATKQPYATILKSMQDVNFYRTFDDNDDWGKRSTKVVGGPQLWLGTERRLRHA